MEKDIKKSIETFDILTGYLFSQLYENFPICQEIKAKSFLAKCELEFRDNELIFSETLFWLRDNGFIAFRSPKEKTISKLDGTIPYPIFSCVELTIKGLNALKKFPNSINSNKSIGEEIIEAIKDGTKDKIKEFVGNILSLATI